MKKLALLAISALVLVPTAAQARPGALDRSFGHGGKVIRPLHLEGEGRRTTPTAIAKLEDGETVVVAGDTLFAFKRDGRPLRSFGGGAVQVTAPSPNSLTLDDVAVDGKGRILVGGTASSALDPSQWGVGSDGSTFLARYNPDGSLDPTFGEGGVVLSDFGASPPHIETYPPRPPGLPTQSPPQSRLVGLAVDSAGQIVLSGLRLDHVSSCRGSVNIWYWDAFAARLREDGEVDPSFGGDGVVAFSGGSGVTPPLLTRSGGVYLWAPAEEGGGCLSGFGLTRFGSNGQRVNTFGEGGSLALGSGRAGELTVDRKGRIVVLDSWGARQLGAPFATVYRVLPSGRLDAGFGEGGEIMLTAPFPSSVVSSIVVDHLGRMVLAGTSRAGLGESGPGSIFVERLTPGGSVDPQFGRNGYTKVRFGRHSESQAGSLALVSAGGILVGGTFTRPATPDGEGLALARLTSR